MANILEIGKAHQRIIREQKQKSDNGGLFGHPIADIKTAICKEITFEQASKVILEYEWLKSMGTTQFHYGIFFEGELAGAICFGYLQAMKGHANRNPPYSNYVGSKYAVKPIQLSRGACVWWAHEHSASKLIAYGLREMSKKGYKFCVAFSDADAGEIGTVYQATNWHYIGYGNSPKHYDIYYKNGKVFMNSRDLSKKLKLVGKGDILKYLEDKPDMEIREQKPKAKYIKLLGNEKENKEMMQVLKDKIQPYPKRKPNGFEKADAGGDNF